MNNLMNAVAGLVSLVVSAGMVLGCGGGAAPSKTPANQPAAEPVHVAEAQPAEPATPADGILDKMRGYKDEVCACTSADCIDAVEERMMKWAMEHMDEMKEITPTKEQDAEADRIEAAMDACRERYASAPPSAPSTAQLTPLPFATTGSAACDRYLKTFDVVIDKCRDKLGPAADALIESRNAQIEAFAQWGTLSKDELRYTVEAAEVGCTSAYDALRQAAMSMGCSL